MLKDNHSLWINFYFLAQFSFFSFWNCFVLFGSVLFCQVYITSHKPIIWVLFESSVNVFFFNITINSYWEEPHCLFFDRYSSTSTVFFFRFCAKCESPTPINISLYRCEHCENHIVIHNCQFGEEQIKCCESFLNSVAFQVSIDFLEWNLFYHLIHTTTQWIVFLL